MYKILLFGATKHLMQQFNQEISVNLKVIIGMLDYQIIDLRICPLENHLAKSCFVIMCYTQQVPTNAHNCKEKLLLPSR